MHYIYILYIRRLPSHERIIHDINSYATANILSLCLIKVTCTVS